MDHASKRALAACVSACRPRPAIVATSHVLGELELADEIVIMVAGTVRHRGNAMQLKGELGLGYRISLAAADPAVPIDIAAVRALAASEAPGSAIEPGGGSSGGGSDDALRPANEPVRIAVPTDAIKHIPRLLRALQDQSAAMGIAAITASAPTLEEVFLRAVEDDDCN
jgi:ABC-type multidrug transport system ATPase subunit